MKRNAKIGVAVLAAVVAVAALVWLVGGRQASGPQQEVRIAANLPITGPLAIWGASIREGAAMALEDLHRDYPDGPKLSVDWQDNTCNAKDAVSIMQKQYLTPPEVYISGIKPQTMAIKDQIEAKGTPHFVWIFDAFINKEGITNNLRTVVNYKIEAPVFLAYARSRRPKRVAILYANLPHAEEEFRVLVNPKLREMGAEVFAEAYDLSLKDYKTLAVKVKDFDPDLIILNGFQHTLVGIVRALRPLDVITDGNTIGTYDMIDAAEVLGKDEIEGIRAVAPYFESRPEQGRAPEWKKRFREKLGKEPLYIHAFAYDMMLIIRDSARRLTRPATPEQWVAALRQTKIEGVTGPLSFDADGDLKTPVEVAVFRNGKLLPEKSDRSGGNGE